MSDFAQQLSHKNASVIDIYSSLFDAAGLSPTLILNRSARAKERGSWALIKKTTSEAANFIHSYGAAAGPLRNSVKTINLPVSKVRHFLHSKRSYSNFTVATRPIRRMKAFDRLNDEILCTELACVEKLAKEKNGV